MRDSKHRNLRDEIDPTVYVPYMQVDPKRGVTYMQFYVRTWQAPEQATNTIRAAMQNLDSKLVVDSLLTVDRQIHNNVTNESIIAFLAVSFGILATFLAAIGLYGVLAFSTTQRTREIGIRMALGAIPRQILATVLREASSLSVIAIAAGIGASILSARFMNSVLFGIASSDPVTRWSAAGLLLIVALGAS